MNWSPTLRIPFVELLDWLGVQRVNDFDPVVVLVHLACPRLEFNDPGKGRFALPRLIANAMKACIQSVTQEWQRVKRRANRDEKLHNKELEEIRKASQPHEKSIREAAWEAMEAAYLKASGDNQGPAKRPSERPPASSAKQP